MLRCCAAMLLGILLALGARDLRADTFLQFTDVAGNPQSVFTIDLASGTTADIGVYLVETAPDNILATEELFSAAVQITHASGIARVLGPGDIVLNSGWDSGSIQTEATATSAGFYADVGPNPFLQLDADGRIFLGRFTFTALSLGTLSLTAKADRDPQLDDVVTGVNGTVLDALIRNASATIQVVNTSAVIPAPPAIYLALIGAAVMCGYARLRRQKSTL